MGFEPAISRVTLARSRRSANILTESRNPATQKEKYFAAAQKEN